MSNYIHRYIKISQNIKAPILFLHVILKFHHDNLSHTFMVTHAIRLLSKLVRHLDFQDLWHL